MLDMMTVSDNLEKLLIKGNYVGKKIGSGCTLDYYPVRDIQFTYGKKELTLSILNNLLYKAEDANNEGYDYGVELNFRKDSFSIYIQRISIIVDTEEEDDDEPCLVKAKTKDCNITVDRHMLVDTILALQTDNRVSKITIWDSPYGGFTLTFAVIDK